MGIVDWEPRVLPSEARCRVWAKKGGVWHLTTSTIDGAFCMARGVRSGYPSDADKPLWRPWKDDNPTTWSEFYAATHPPIPEGWEAVGEWFAVKDGVVLAVENHWLSDNGTVSDGWPAERPVYMICLRRILPAIPEDWEAVGEWCEFIADSDVTFGTSGAIRFYDDFILQDRRRHTAGERSWSVAVRPLPRASFRAVADASPADWADIPRGTDLKPTVIEGVPHNYVVVRDVQMGSVRQLPHGDWVAYGDNGKSVHPTLPAAIVALTGRRE